MPLAEQFRTLWLHNTLHLAQAALKAQLLSAVHQQGSSLNLEYGQCTWKNREICDFLVKVMDKLEGTSKNILVDCKSLQA